MNRHGTVRIINGKVAGGGLACFAFLDGHAEQWDCDAFAKAFTTPGLPAGMSPLWASPKPPPADPNGGYNPNYVLGYDITPYVQLN